MIRRFRVFFDRIDGLQAWLNRMARSGKRLHSVENHYYVFEECPKGEYEYRVRFLVRSECQMRQKQMEERGYRVFLLAGGFGAGNARMRMVVERKQEDGPFSIFSDTQERRACVARIKRFYLAGAGILALVILFVPFGYYLAVRLAVALAFLYCLGRAFGYYKKGWSLDHDGEIF